MNNNTKAFFALLRAGLWEREVRLSTYKEMDFSEVLQLAEEQSVVGLVTAGLEHVADVQVPLDVKLLFAGRALQIEQRNIAMNRFIAELMQHLKDADIKALLVKGQGVAQCYKKPLWRTCGDVDLLLDKANNKKAKMFLIPLASHVSNENKTTLHQGMTIGSWEVELHGTLHSGFSKKMDNGIDEIQRDCFENGGVRVWINDGVEVLLPNVNNDILIVFTHFIQHFYVGGVGLRQICDWCRLLWTYRDEIDCDLLETRLKKMGLISEWKAFASFAVEYLYMPSGTIPLYEKSISDSRKARRLCSLMFKSGNLGHNHDESYRSKYPNLVQKSITFGRRLGGFSRRAAIFPINSPKFFMSYSYNKIKEAK